MRDLNQHPFEMRSLTGEEGGTFLNSLPDFSEGIAHGQTPDVALHHGLDALVTARLAESLGRREVQVV
jgi:hypothetical protein